MTQNFSKNSFSDRNFYTCRRIFYHISDLYGKTRFLESNFIFIRIFHIKIYDPKWLEKWFKMTITTFCYVLIIVGYIKIIFEFFQKSLIFWTFHKQLSSKIDLYSNEFPLLFHKIFMTQNYDVWAFEHTLNHKNLI